MAGTEEALMNKSGQEVGLAKSVHRCAQNSSWVWQVHGCGKFMGVASSWV